MNKAAVQFFKRATDSTLNSAKLIFNYYRQKDESPSRKSRFEFLDGYRGSLCLVVIIHHAQVNAKCELINMLKGYSQTYAIGGFFMLSAFLLTYRLLNDLTKTSDPWIIADHLIKYFIRRFFRIYVYMVAFYALAKYQPYYIGTPRLKFRQTLYNVITLGPLPDTQLWTIPPEIKYYLVVPIFSLMAKFCGRLQPILLAGCISWTISDQAFNFFGLTHLDGSWSSPRSHELRGNFAVFFMGSQVALAFFLCEHSPLIQRFVKVSYVARVLDYSSLIVALAGLKFGMYRMNTAFGFKPRVVAFWSVCLFLTLLVRSTIVSRFFETSHFLKKLGKYSFSVYLFHFIPVFFTSALFRNLLTQPEIVSIAVFGAYYLGKVMFYLVEKPLMDLANCICYQIDAWMERKRGSLNENSRNDSEMMNLVQTTERATIDSNV